MIPDTNPRVRGAVQSFGNSLIAMRHTNIAIKTLRLAEVVHYSPQRTLRLFSGVMHPNHLCALGGLCGEPEALLQLARVI